MPMKLKYYYKKQSILIFAPYNFLMFLDTPLHEPKIFEMTISEYFGDGVLVFSGENLLREARYAKDREWVLQI